MSLAASGHVQHPIVKNAIRFIVDSVRPDGSWPIDTNLSIWLTGLSINALAAGGEDLAELGSLEWLLGQQQLQKHRYTGAEPGGWAWTDLNGGVPDADDTAGALLALSAFARQHAEKHQTAIPETIHAAAEAGMDWLLKLQNRDGGWPTFCRGWGKLPFDRSGTDLTAHAIRALHCWYINFDYIEDYSALDRELRAAKILDAIDRGFAYLQRQQREDGSWLPLWFGNQAQPDESNPIYGTAKVLLCYHALGKADSDTARRGFDFLLSSQDLGGGWGGSGKHISQGQPHRSSSVEETSLAIEALLADPRLADSASLQHMVNKGLAWLTDVIERNCHTDAAPIGFYFAKLWYYERLYPTIFTVSALGTALHRTPAGSERS
jgi:squalene-hopene/tetraprenyl-beta-curcumene cyclase